MGGLRTFAIFVVVGLTWADLVAGAIRVPSLTWPSPTETSRPMDSSEQQSWRTVSILARSSPGTRYVSATSLHTPDVADAYAYEHLFSS